MKRHIVIAAVLVALMTVVSTGSSFAANYEGSVTSVAAASNIIYFTISGVTYAACAPNQRYILNGTTQLGKNSYALLLSANLAGKRVGVWTAGACTTSPNDAEDVNVVYLPPQ